MIKTKVIEAKIKKTKSFLGEETKQVSSIYEELEKWLRKNLRNIKLISITESDSKWVMHHFTIIYDDLSK